MWQETEVQEAGEMPGARCYRPPGLHSEDSRWLPEDLEHGAARSKGAPSGAQGHLEKKKIIMNEKVRESRSFSKPILNLSLR